MNFRSRPLEGKEVGDLKALSVKKIFDTQKGLANFLRTNYEVIDTKIYDSIIFSSKDNVF